MTKHALLSASSSYRWLTCPPLPRLESYFENKTSEAAHEGTLAHVVAENKLRKALGMTHRTIQVSDTEMDTHTDDYVTYIMELLERIKKTFQIMCQTDLVRGTVSLWQITVSILLT